MATLQTTGTISIQEINAEFGLGNSLDAYRGTTWFMDDGSTGSFPSGLISINDFYGKRKTSPGGQTSYVNPLGFNGQTYSVFVDGSFEVGASASISLEFSSDGMWVIYGSGWGSGGEPFSDVEGGWVNPPSQGNLNFALGNYVRFTRTTNSGGGSGGSSSSPSSGWLSISPTNSPQITVLASAGFTLNTFRTAAYTVELATDSTGSNIVSSSTLTLSASASGTGG